MDDVAVATTFASKVQEDVMPTSISSCMDFVFHCFSTDMFAFETFGLRLTMPAL